MMTINTLSLFTLAASLLCLTACKSSNPVEPESPFKQFQGVWLQQGYGQVLEITEENYRYYQVSEVSCLPSQQGTLEGLELSLDQFEVNTSQTQMKLQYHGNYTEFYLNKVSALPAQCLGETPAPSDPEYNFEVLWHTFNEQYAFFEQRNVNWAAAYAEFRPQVSASTTSAELKEIMVSMLSRFKEDHVSLTDEYLEYRAGEVPALLARIAQEFAAQSEVSTLDEYIAIQQQRILQILAVYLGGDVKQAANGQVIWGKLNDHTGYLALAQMQNFTESTDFDSQMAALESALDQVFADLSDTQSLVLDLRLNGGGMAESALRVARRMISQDTPVFSVSARDGTGFTPEQVIALSPAAQPWTGSIVVLTSSVTASAAEVQLLSLLSLPITVIGEKTAGIFSNRLVRQLPNGWHFSLSNEVYRDRDGVSYEASGFQPDIAMDVFLKSDRDAGTDAAIERALELLQ
ncbi:S41 family peptidase [Pleionea sp. CnH1-48]|uniref:S41 family peptidase n=1 Tax=Pleionea sp. CnH1-48 TaxID=2954494 RepID=UPI00209856A1|nr:S41 family peptidase [Pleionea sp. CnH1-48]MCO7223749.1 S41 family peptidase [Pleionea sp. CnH1-48]